MLTQRQECVWLLVPFMRILMDFSTRQVLREFVLAYVRPVFTQTPTQESATQLASLPFTQTTGLIDVWITVLIHLPMTATEFAWTFVTQAATQAPIIPPTNVCSHAPQCPITTTKTACVSSIARYLGTLPTPRSDSVSADALT